jgi:hypothetical protein
MWREVVLMLRGLHMVDTYFSSYLVSNSFSLNTKMCSGTTDCNGLSSTYSYVHNGTRMTVSFMFCALVASYGVRMVVQSLSTTRANLPSP